MSELIGHLIQLILRTGVRECQDKLSAVDTFSFPVLAKL